MNWLDRARSEIQKGTPQPTANSAEGNPMAVMSVPRQAVCEKSRATVDLRARWTLPELLADWDERAGIMMDSGMSRADAERAAWLLVIHRPDRLH